MTSRGVAHDARARTSWRNRRRETRAGTGTGTVLVAIFSATTMDSVPGVPGAGAIPVPVIAARSTGSPRALHHLSTEFFELMEKSIEGGGTSPETRPPALPRRRARSHEGARTSPSRWRNPVEGSGWATRRVGGDPTRRTRPPPRETDPRRRCRASPTRRTRPCLSLRASPSPGHGLFHPTPGRRARRRGSCADTPLRRPDPNRTRTRTRTRTVARDAARICARGDGTVPRPSRARATLPRSFPWRSRRVRRRRRRPCDASAQPPDEDRSSPSRARRNATTARVKTPRGDASAMSIRADHPVKRRRGGMKRIGGIAGTREIRDRTRGRRSRRAPSRRRGARRSRGSGGDDGARARGVLDRARGPGVRSRARDGREGRRRRGGADGWARG